MTKTRDLADLGGGFIQAGTGAVQRTVESKLQDVVSVKDFGAVGDGVADDTVAIQAAFDALNGKGTVVFDGTYIISSEIVVDDIDYIIVKGEGQTAFVPVTTSAKFTFNLRDNNAKMIVLKDLNIYPGCLTGATETMFKFYVPFAASVAYSQVVVDNVTCITNTLGDGLELTVKCLFELVNIWAPRFTNCVFFPTKSATPPEGTAMFSFSDVVDPWATRCIQHSGQSMVYQVGYCEGINLVACSIIGAQHLIFQKSGITPRFANNTVLYQMQVVACECATKLGTFKLYKTDNLFVTKCSHSRDSNGNWIAYDLIDCGFTASVGDVFVGGGASGGTRKVINITNNEKTSQYNTWSASLFRDIDFIADIGAGVERTAILRGFGRDDVAPSTLVTDAGTKSFFDVNGQSFGNLPVGLGTYAAFTNYDIAGKVLTRGYCKNSDSGVFNSPTGVGHEFRSTQNGGPVVRMESTNSGFTNIVGLLTADKAANSDFSFLYAFSSHATSPDAEFRLQGDGNAYADGSWAGGGADYAEYFEWSDGNPNNEDRRGVSVVLDGDKIREAQAGEDPIGVISGNPSVVGDAAWNKWRGKYLQDEFGTYIQEDYEVTDDDGNTVTQQRRKLNPTYDPNVEYVSREERPEWGCVGLMGKLRVRKGQIIDSRWIKMRDITETVSEYLVR